MDMILNDIVNKIRSVIDPKCLESTELFVKENKTSYDSLMIRAKPTIYRVGYDATVLFARIKLTGKITYISFPSGSKKYLDGHISFETTKSDDFFRIDPEIFLKKLNDPDFCAALNTISLNAFHFSSFGCCGRFEECSNNKRCTHPDPVYASACDYKKHLDAGKIFY